ncbi:MAG: hypothetical protein AAFZ52_08460 [Bacteroidota bacterium]
MRTFWLFFGFVLFLSAGCREEFGGDRLFEVAYPVQDVFVPAGVVFPTTHVFAVPRLPTTILSEMQRTDTGADDIEYIGGLRARVTSLNGEDFAELESIDLRVCPVGQPLGCQILDRMFITRDLFGRRDLVVNLNPVPLERNFRNLLLTDEEVRLEVVFTPGQTTSRVVEARVEWAIHAVGNLE